MAYLAKSAGLLDLQQAARAIQGTSAVLWVDVPAIKFPPEWLIALPIAFLIKYG